jgi:Protein of unknown function (DUF1592)/Protein of unknown function (DUF1588)/Protein of unknown function (DUF1595)/Protein of unknown function (DUF1585)/Protein of unknown function (DUF1587)
LGRGFRTPRDNLFAPEVKMHGSFASHLRLGPLFLALLVPGAACTGMVSPPGSVPDGTGGTGSTQPGVTGTTSLGTLAAAACAKSKGALNVGVSPLRRLTRTELNNTLGELLKGIVQKPADLLVPDERIGPFESNAIAPITDLLVQQHQEMAATLATAARAQMAQISPCDLVADAGTTCATRFVTEFGLRAYRRPLDSTEIQNYVRLYTLGKTGDGAANGFALVVQAMLQSPFFLYHHDVGATGVPQASTVAITPHELASRLSFFLWNSMPDAPLFAVAANGTLMQDGVIAAQVERMLADSKAAATIALFHSQWLQIDDLGNAEKDAALFPLFSPDLADAMQQETAMFVDNVILKGDGLLKSLFTSNVSFPQGGLFSVYGINQPSGFTVGSPVMLPANQRSGLLTRAAFLTQHSHRDQTSPVHRGLIIRENLLCTEIPSPPVNANTTPPPPTAITSTRQRFAQHESDLACSGCHTLMDPIGLGLENYDSIGMFRTKDGLGDVDPTGQINKADPDVAGAFTGALELSNKLAQSKQVSDCVASQWFRFSMGRMETTDDACSMQAIYDGFRTSSGNIRTLLGQIAKSAAFRNVRTTGG